MSPYSCEFALGDFAIKELIIICNYSQESGAPSLPHHPSAKENDGSHWIALVSLY